jgi:hypothetical protein
VEANTTQADEHEVRDRQPPAPEDLSEGIVRLLEEVDATLASDRWAIINKGTDHVTWLVYDAAALRHCCQLLHEIEVAAQTNQEWAARLLGRAHLEAWLVGLYLHYGGFDALVRVAQDTRHGLEAMNHDAEAFDKWLTGEKKSARKNIRKVEAANNGIQRWNEVNPTSPPKALLDTPYVLRLQPADIDLSRHIAAFGDHEAQPLPVSDIVNLLTDLGPERGFALESFRPIYLIYRVLSSIGTHANLNVLEPYIARGNFTRTTRAPAGGSAIDTIRITALHGTAFLAGAVLGDQGCPTPAANAIRAWLEPDPSGRAAWTPGV